MRRFLQEYLDSGASQYAGMLAFSLFVGLLPVLLGVLTVWGILATAFGRHRNLQVAQQILVEMVPADAQGAVRHVVLGAGEQLGVIALVSVLGLLWFSTGIFSATGFALNRIHGLPNRPFLAQRLRGMWLPLALFVSAHMAVAVNIGVRLWSVPAFLGPIAIWLALTYVIGFLYRLAPSRELRRTDVVPGACLAAAVIVGLGYAFPVYTWLTGHLSSGSRFFAAVFGLVAWVYFIAQAVLIGAVVNRIRMESAAARAAADGSAVPLDRLQSGASMTDFRSGSGAGG